MKKVFALLLALTMVLSLAACGAKEEPAPEKEEAPKAEQEAETPAAPEKAEDEKFVTLVELGAKGTEPVYKKLPLCPGRRVRKLTGTMEEVLNMAKMEKCHDYVSITLTDEVEAYQPREQLEEVYDHILEIRIDNSRTRKLLELGEFETENLEPYEAFCHFFAEINGREMTAEEDAMLMEVLQEGGLIEAE